MQSQTVKRSRRGKDVGVTSGPSAGQDDGVDDVGQSLDAVRARERETQLEQ